MNSLLRQEDLINPERFEEILSSYGSVPPILVIGDIGLDKYTQGQVRRISPEAPVPILEVQEESYKLGLAANISDNLMALEMSSLLVGITGKDAYAASLKMMLEERSLQTSGLIPVSDRKTTLKERVTTKMQQICRIDHETARPLNAEETRHVLDCLGPMIKHSSEIHGLCILEDYAKGFLTEDICREVIQLCRQQNIPVFVDPGRTTPPHFYRGASLLKPNAVEAEALVAALGYKEQHLEKMAMILSEELEIPQVVITLGGQGMALFEQSHNHPWVEIIPTLATEVYDVSGAGDTVISVLAASTLAKATLQEAAWMANCAAGVVVAKKGTATVNKEELRKFYQKLRQEFV
jgi:rfaE bifunctional protein kinase chain/domain